MAGKKPTKGFGSERRRQLIERILRNVRVDEETGCWLWTRRINNGGYPIITMRMAGRAHPVPLFAHRVMCELFKGPPPEGYQSAHDVLCPFPHCVHPDHLRWATPLENAADKRHPSRLRVRLIPPPKHTLAGAFA